MAEALAIDGTEYIHAALAGRRFGYTGTYLIMLARDGRIRGQKVGKRWYIDPESVSRFVSDAEKVREARSEIIREARKAELRAYAVANEKQFKVRVPKASVALLETLAILVIGLTIGAVGYFGTTTTSQTAQVSKAEYSFLERFALAFYEFINPAPSVTVREVTLVATEERALPAVIVGTTTHTALVIGPDEVMNTTTVETIRDSFSDEVSVSLDPEHPDTGIIIPHFKNHDGRAYRFLMVPMETDSSGSDG